MTIIACDFWARTPTYSLDLVEHTEFDVARFQTPSGDLSQLMESLYQTDVVEATHSFDCDDGGGVVDLGDGTFFDLYAWEETPVNAETESARADREPEPDTRRNIAPPNGSTLTERLPTCTLSSPKGTFEMAAAALDRANSKVIKRKRRPSLPSSFIRRVSSWTPSVWSTSEVRSAWPGNSEAPPHRHGGYRLKGKAGQYGARYRRQR